MIAIIKYNSGNVQSVQNALARIGKESLVTDDHDLIRSASHVIFPGVGHAAAAMKYLQEKDLDKILPTLTQPVLGVCLGMQLMCSHTEEGDIECLNIFKTPVKKFINNSCEVNKIPHMGWNNITELRSPLFEKIKETEFVYYVHSYYATISEETIATTDYIFPFSGALHKDNFFAVQFHPEKSGETGEKILKNFIAL